MAEHSIEMVCFRAGAYRCAIESRRVIGSHTTAPGSSTPTVEDKLNLSAATSGQRQTLMLHTDSDLSVGVPVDLRGFEYSAIHPLPPLLAARCALRGLKGLGIDQEGLVLLVDPGT